MKRVLPQRLPCSVCGRTLHAKRFRLVDRDDHANGGRSTVCLRCEYDCRAGLQIRATPIWADGAQIKEFYAAAKQMTEQTGTPHEVDHVVPIISDVVCGLHVHDNLQIVTRDQNRLKANSLTGVQN